MLDGLFSIVKRFALKWLMVAFNRDISGLFVHLNQTYKYVICKFEKRQSEMFPYTFLLGSEVDILCNQNDIVNISKLVKEWLVNKYCHLRWIEISEEKSDGHVLVYIYVRRRTHKYVCFCVDVQSMSVFCFSQEYLAYCIQQRVLFNGLCYINCPKCEIPIRAFELYNHPHKTWHKEYIKGAMSYYDSGILESACNSNHDLLKNLKDVIINCSKDIDSSQCP